MSWKPNDAQRILMNPAYVVTVSPTLCTAQPPMVSKQQWVQANANLIKQVGAEAWLRELLEMLETGGTITKPSR